MSPAERVDSKPCAAKGCEEFLTRAPSTSYTAFAKRKYCSQKCRVKSATGPVITRSTSDAAAVDTGSGWRQVGDVWRPSCFADTPLIPERGAR